MIEDVTNTIKGKLGLSGFDFSLPETYIPIITSDQYEYGYITRYFISRINMFYLTETTSQCFKLVDSKFFIKTKIMWKVSGPEFNVYNNNILEITGVVNYNKLRIIDLNSIIFGSDVILNNPRQFWRGF